MKTKGDKGPGSAKPNKLIGEESLYLLQHAYNPVQWYPWGEEARAKAKEENKLILVSIGYSACHWCHVMERESFEDPFVAEVMNHNFICIKVDREERPDVDQVYMEAVQMMRRQGGWPLNCFTTPDGDPIYGGTYFSNSQWLELLDQLKNIWTSEPNQALQYGKQLREGMQVTGLLSLDNTEWQVNKSTIETAIIQWTQHWDKEFGGPNKAPKFPLPCNYLFLLHWASATADSECLNQVQTTLNHMMSGGIHDQVGGGFARYSTDVHWKVPHFEKMLYDNAQLLQLFSEGYAHFGFEAYRETALDIINWLEREMKLPDGSYASAIDADSEGEEGAYYTYHPDELTAVGLFEKYSEYYHTGEKALWEGKLVAIRRTTLNTDQEDQKYHDGLKKLNAHLLHLREKREPPARDTKRITSWNAMLASAFIKAERYAKYPNGLLSAEAILKAIDSNHDSFEIEHLVESSSQKIGFCEDYAFLIAAWLDHYELGYKSHSLLRAKALMDIALDKYYSLEQGIFFQTTINQTDLPLRPVELSDNVNPSANSVMAKNMSRLYNFGFEAYSSKYQRLLHGMQTEMLAYPEGYGNWWDLYLHELAGQIEIVVSGPEANSWAKQLQNNYTPQINWAVSNIPCSLSIFTNRYDSALTQVYICRNKTCSLPFTNLAQAQKAIENLKIIALAN